MSEVPWTVRAWAEITHHRAVPSYTLSALERDGGNVPPLPIFCGGSDGLTWSTLGGVRNTSLHAGFKRYAEQHGHVIPDEVLSVWQAYEDSQLVMRLIEDAVGGTLRTVVDEGERAPSMMWAAAAKAVVDLATAVAPASSE